MSQATAVDNGEQATLLDLSGKEFNLMWVDEQQPLFVANNPTHWKAHKLQVALDRMEKQQKTNPAQFNATVYFAALDKLGDLMAEINKGELDEVLDTAGVADERTGRSKAPHVGDGASAGVHTGVSADNPFAGQGTNSA
jgi:hypothetical protein